MTTGSPILPSVTRALTPVIVLLSIYLLLRGHNAPGGGFIAALVAGAAIMLRFLAGGQDEIRRLVPVEFSTFLGVGLTLCAGVGIAALFAGREFLASALWRFRLPILGEMKVSSSLLFDVGVYLVVVGVVVAGLAFLAARDEEGIE